ncbi:MAG: DUF5895 domain-containing protein [Cyanobacteria bacterium P01_G01_bin.67]
MNNYQDFGFGGDEFRGEMTTVPYCQFLNASKQKFGIAITPTNAELAEFKPDESWQAIEHEFSDGTNENLLVSQQPRLLILNRSQALMSDGVTTLPYSKVKFAEGEYKAFSYVVVWFLDRQNKPLSELPFRLKCSGYAGLTFLKNYSYYNNPNSFCKQFLNIYKSLTGDRAINKNDVFYAHGVYQPNLVRQKATSSHNGQSSFAVMTDSFKEPTTDNFGSLIIKNGSPLSHKIKQFQETTKSWLKTASVEPEVEPQPLEDIQQTVFSVNEMPEVSTISGIEAGLTPEPVRF